METTSVRFAAAARELARVARSTGMRVPSFRSPPRLERADRSIRRRPDGGATVSVRLRGRPWPAVLADMIEGVVVANGLHGVAADRLRASLWESAVAMQGAADPTRLRVVPDRGSAGRTTVVPPARVA